MKILVSIPAYNEGKTIGRLIEKIHNVMQKKEYKYAIQVVDDGSRDNTKTASEKANAHVISHPRNYGLAETFKTEIEGFLKSNADIFVHIDADEQYIPEEIPKLIKGIEGGADLVLGSRFKGKIESMPWLKKFGNKAFSRVISYISKQKISDAQTGFRAFNREVAEKVGVISTFTYTQEQIIRAAKLKFKIVEIPIYFAKRDGKSRLMKNPIDFALRAGINLFRIIRDYAPLTFFGITGLLIMSVGVILSLYVLYLFLTTGAIGRLPTIMLSVLLITTGLQIIFFGFLADMLRK